MKAIFSLSFAVVFLIGCGQKQEQPAKTQDSSGNPVTAPVDYLGAVVKAKKSAEKTIDTVSLTQQIQLFSGQEGRYPTSLDELVAKKYIPALPTPPYGMRFDYNPQSGEVKVVPK